MAGALDAGIKVSDLDRDYPRLAEKPFSSERRAMSVKVATKEGALICVKGASDRIIPACVSQVVGGKTLPLGPRDRKPGTDG